MRDPARRGSLKLNLIVSREASPDNYQLNAAVVLNYHRQLKQLSEQIDGAVPQLEWNTLLALPGAVSDRQSKTDVEQEWPTIERVVRAGLEQLNAMRAREGQALAVDLLANCDVIARELSQVELRAPDIVRAYETRLLDRINQLLADQGVKAEPSVIVREVGVFADRADIAEEIVRLRSHLDQFASIVNHETAPGRKLDFMIQEMLRETNTIGSKANDAQVARHVVEMKTAIERLREMVQNVE